MSASSDLCGRTACVAALEIGVIETVTADMVISDAETRIDRPFDIPGSHGRTGIGRMLFGLETKRAINVSSGPVLVVGNA